VKQSLAEQAFTELNVPREKLAEWLKAQAAEWGKLVVDSGVKID
jgi:hypothetical protein